MIEQISGKKPFAEDIPCLRKDGSIMYGQCNANPLHVAGKIFLVAVVRDMSARKRADEILRASEDALSAAF